MSFADLLQKPDQEFNSRWNGRVRLHDGICPGRKVIPGRTYPSTWKFFAAVCMALGQHELVTGLSHLSTWQFPCCYLHGFRVRWTCHGMNSLQNLVQGPWSRGGGGGGRGTFPPFPQYLYKYKKISVKKCLVFPPPDIEALMVPPPPPPNPKVAPRSLW